MSSDFSEPALSADSSNFLEDAEEFESLPAGLAEPADLLLLCEETLLDRRLFGESDAFDPGEAGVLDFLSAEWADLELTGDFGLEERTLPRGDGERDLADFRESTELLEATDFGLPLLDRAESDFSLWTEPTLERLEPDPGEAGLSDLRLPPSSLFDSTEDLEARLMFDAGEAGAPFSSSECSPLLTLLDVCAGPCDARLPLRLDLEDAEPLSDSDPENGIEIRIYLFIVQSLSFSFQLGV